jgi:hypothetical protein
MRLSPKAANAEIIAIEALGWLAADEGRLERFLAISGLGPQNLRKAASEPPFLTAILDYLASNEALLVDFAHHSGRSPEDVVRAGVELDGSRAGAPL